MAKKHTSALLGPVSHGHSARRKRIDGPAKIGNPNKRCQQSEVGTVIDTDDEVGIPFSAQSAKRSNLEVGSSQGFHLKTRFLKQEGQISLNPSDTRSPRFVLELVPAPLKIDCP